MKKKCRYGLIIIVIVLCLLVVKILLFLIARPKIAIDYPAKINALSKPLNYDPNKDGLRYLTEASELYVKILNATAGKLWPNEMNEVEMSILRQWLAANSDAFEAYRKAGECEYIWMKLKESSGSSGRDLSNRPENEIDVRGCLFWDAKFKAFEGSFDEALENLLDTWKVAIKSTNSNYPLGKQMLNLMSQEEVLDTAIDIVDVYRPSASDLEKWQKEWQKQFELDSYVPGFESVRLDCYDWIQKGFVHKEDGSGRLYWKELGKHVPTCDCVSTLDVSLIPFIGPTESDMRSAIDSMITRYKDLIKLTPAEVRYPEQQYIKAKEGCSINHRMWKLLDGFVPHLNSFSVFYYRVKMRRDAFITILATLRFKEQHGSYPSNLDELVQEGFLKDLPRDPFSRGSLRYVKLENDFGLYSVGPDFADDGGRRGFGNNLMMGTSFGDEVFWPPLRKGRKNIASSDMEIIKRFGPY